MASTELKKKVLSNLIMSYILSYRSNGKDYHTVMIYGTV